VVALLGLLLLNLIGCPHQLQETCFCTRMTSAVLNANRPFVSTRAGGDSAEEEQQQAESP
jgi:hypothetical protein